MFIKQNIKKYYKPSEYNKLFFSLFIRSFIDFCLKKNIKNFYKICLLLKIFWGIITYRVKTIL